MEDFRTQDDFTNDDLTADENEQFRDLQADEDATQFAGMDWL